MGTHFRVTVGIVSALKRGPPQYPVSVVISMLPNMLWVQLESRSNTKISHFGVQSPYFWRRQWHPTPVLLPGKSHGWGGLVGCSPSGHEQSDTTEQLHFRFSLSCIGEGNGNPLQCSCLVNPRDGGAWWAAVYGVTQSRTRLKWLSSSSSSLFFHTAVEFCIFFPTVGYFLYLYSESDLLNSVFF